MFTETGVRTSYPNPWDADNSGATFRNQDKLLADKSQYNWDHGVLVYSFRLPLACPKGNYEIRSKLAHTWSGAALTSITVTIHGISATFSGTNEHWQAVNPIARSWYPCGLA